MCLGVVLTAVSMALAPDHGSLPATDIARTFSGLRAGGLPLGDSTRLALSLVETEPSVAWERDVTKLVSEMKLPW